MAGGTKVMIGGMFLSVGNGVKGVLLNGAMCVILQSSSTQVTCTSSSRSVRGVGAVAIYIDNEVTMNNAVTFEYTNNPNYTSVSPLRTIPAGGIILFFSGMYLNVTQKALLVINGVTSPCNQTFSALKCYAPPLGSGVSGSILLPGVNYTIVMDGAPGPVGDSLKIKVAPNPTFTSINTADQKQIIGSVKSITIYGGNIMNVDQTEITVTVSGQDCAVNLVTSYAITCNPPNLMTINASYSVTVSVGLNLQYDVGLLQYITIGSGSGGNIAVGEAFPVAAVAGGVGGGAIILLLLMIFVVCVIVAIHRKDSLQKSYQISVLMSQVRAQEENTKDGRAPPSFPVGRNVADFLSQYTGTVISSDHIHVLSTIGEGEFGVVYKAQFFQMGANTEPQLVAVKTMKGLFTMNDLSSMMSEILKMQDFSHPHVMTLIGVSFDANHTPSMVMPFMANGSLLSYLKKNRSFFLLPQTADEETLSTIQKLLMKMCYQIAQGMEYLAENKFVHRDLAARNCMIDGDGVIKVGDFGLSEDVYRTGYMRVNKGSSQVRLPFKWLAPESIQDGVFNEKTDVWSYGVTCYEIFSCGKLPYAGVDPCDLAKFLERGRRLEKPENATCSETMYSLMLKCWDSDPDDRPSFVKISSNISKTLHSMSTDLKSPIEVDMTSIPIMPSGSGEIVLANNTAIGSEQNNPRGKEIEAAECEAYPFKSANNNERQHLDGNGYIPMGGISEDTSEYIIPNEAHDDAKNENKYINMSAQDLISH